MIEKLVESNAKTIESLRNQAPEDRALIQQFSESAQQITDAVARLESSNSKSN
jgi:hypothetical protein